MKLSVLYFMRCWSLQYIKVTGVHSGLFKKGKFEK